MKARLWIGLTAGLAAAGFGFVAIARAQAPAVPVLPGTVAPAAAPTNFWSRILLTPEQKANCRDAYCRSGIGQLANGFTAPLNFVTGGLVTDHCLTNLIEKGLEQPADSAVGAAARIKADEAAAKARRDAVRYLGTVDCNWWPEAQDALIAALRGDRNECVRWEAAIALTKGCCCTKKVIEALAVSVASSDRDGFPPENSERVRATAADALGHCVSVYVSPPVEPRGDDPRKEQKLDERKTELRWDPLESTCRHASLSIL